MTFKQFLTEAVPLSLARKYLKDWDKDRLKDWFAGKYRTYIPLIYVDVKKAESDVEKQVTQTLQNTQFKLKDYEQGIVLDTKNKDREVKLGKVLQKMGSEDLLKSFNADPFRQGKSLKQELPIVVISRHPYDIIGQSYDRGWTSCKNLSTGSNAKYLAAEAKLTLVAYLIRQDDKNIKKPIARILIVPLIGDKLDVKYFPHDTVYGTAGELEKAFKKTINDWLESKQGKLLGRYKTSPYVYLDALKSEYDFKDVSKLPDWVIESGNTPDAWEYDKDGNFVWMNGTWRNGTWRNGTWEKGTWKDGTWEWGVWKRGTWEDGTWEDGTWKGGTWWKGTWKWGVWKDGTWKDGTWKDGTWEKGTWKGGTWKGGYDKNNKKQTKSPDTW